MYSTYQVNTARLPKRRRRPALSCRECRKRKIKCDRNEPCNRCTFSKRTCDYGDCIDPNKASRLTQSATAIALPYPSPSSVSQTQSNLSPVEALGDVGDSDQMRNVTASFSDSHQRSRGIDSGDLREALRQGLEHRRSDQAFSRNGSHDHHELHSTLSPNVVASEKHDLNDLYQRLAKIEQLLPNATDPEVSLSQEPNSEFARIFDFKSTPQMHDGKTTLNKTRMFGQTHWALTAYGFRRLTAFLRHDLQPDSSEAADTERLRSEVRSLLQKCKALARLSKSWRPSRSFTCPLLTLIPPSRELGDKLATLYITRFESAMRIVHVPSFWKEYEQFWANPIGAPDMLKYKVYLVMAAGASLYRNAAMEEEVRSNARTWVYCAHAWIAGPLEKDRCTVSGLQIHCLLALARQLIAVNGDLIFISMGTVVRMAMQMGLHHDPRRFESMSIFQSEIRRRLWATILELSIQASLDAGMPAHISYDDFDTLPPTNLDDTDIDEFTTSLEHTRPNAVTDTSLQIFLLSSVPTRFEMIKRMNSVRGSLKYPDLLEISSKLMPFCYQCGLHIKKSTELLTTDIFRHNFADLLLRRFPLSLHRAFAARATRNPLFYYSRKTSVDLALALLTPTPNEDFSHLVVVGSGIFKNRMAHTSLSISSELVNELGEDGILTNSNEAAPTLRQPKPSHAFLVIALEECRRQILTRIEKGDANVRPYMMACMVLAQANRMGTDDAAATGRSVLEAAKESLECVLSVMQARQMTSQRHLETDMTFVGRNVDSGLSADFLTQDLSGDFDFDSLWQNVDFMIYGEADGGGSGLFP